MIWVKRVWALFGKAAYYGLYPLLIVYLHKSERTRLLLISQDKVLMIKGWLCNGKWGLPGGGLHVGEEPTTGLLRELKEETGILIDLKELTNLGSYRIYYHRFYITYHGFVAHIPLQPAVKRQKGEILEATWLPVKDIGLETCSPEVAELVSRWHTQVKSAKM